mgnify:CR=1 FL=1
MSGVTAKDSGVNFGFRGSLNENTLASNITATPWGQLFRDYRDRKAQPGA